MAADDDEDYKRRYRDLVEQNQRVAQDERREILNRLAAVEKSYMEREDIETRIDGAKDRISAIEKRVYAFSGGISVVAFLAGHFWK